MAKYITIDDELHDDLKLALAVYNRGKDSEEKLNMKSITEEVLRSWCDKQLANRPRKSKAS